MGFCTPDQTDRFLATGAGGREGHGRFRDHPAQVLARGQRRRSRPDGIESRDRRPAQDVEALGHRPEVVQPLVRLLPSPRRDVRRRPTPTGRRGTSRTTTTRSAAGSTSSATCSPASPTSRSPTSTSSCRSGRSAATYRQPAARPSADPDPVLSSAPDEMEEHQDRRRTLGAPTALVRARHRTRSRPGCRSTRLRALSAAEAAETPAGVRPERAGPGEDGADLEAVPQALPRLHADRPRRRCRRQPAHPRVRDRDRPVPADAVQRVARLPPGGQGRGGRRGPRRDDEVGRQGPPRRRHRSSCRPSRSCPATSSSSTPATGCPPTGG